MKNYALLLAVAALLAFGGPSPAQTYVDNFAGPAGTNLTAHTADTGQTYAADAQGSGTALLSGAGSLYSTSGAVFQSSFRTAGPAVNASFSLKVLSASADAGIMLFSNGNGTYYLVRVDTSGGLAPAQLQCYKRVAGAFSLVGFINVTLPAGATATFNLSASLSGGAENIVVSQGGATLTTFSDTSTPLGGSGGYVGVWQATQTPATTGGIQLAQVTASDPAGPATTAVSLTSPLLMRSPGNWRYDGSVLSTIHEGSYLKFAWSGGGAVSVTFDTSLLSGLLNAAANSASNVTAPVAEIIVDGQPPALAPLVPGTTQTLSASGAGAGRHWAILYYRATRSDGDKWGSAGVNPSNSLRVTSVGVATGASLVSASGTPAAAHRKKVLILSDSTSCGWVIHTNPVSQDAVAAWPVVLEQDLDAEVGVDSLVGQGVIQAVGGNAAPNAQTTYALYDGSGGTGASKLAGGVYIQPWDLIIIQHGDNDYAFSDSFVAGPYAAFLASLRAAAPNVPIVWCVPFSGIRRASIAAAVAGAGKGVTFVDLATDSYMYSSVGAATFGTYDGLHPDDLVSGQMGALIARMTRPILYPATGRPAGATPKGGH